MSDPQSLFDSLAAAHAEKRLPPVAQWQPERQGRIDIRIAADGSWYHDGVCIRRAAMVRLFSTVLRKDPDGYCLVTPVEKLIIEVEDAPFVAVDLEVKGTGRNTELMFVTNVEDCVVADHGHELRVTEHKGQPRPYVHVRDGLDALINRAVFYRLVDLGIEEGDECCVYSRGERFSLGRTT
ncbi:MAG: DUF1285 domain-containing protein [Pseudomonadales bacterium]|jgi:hypothetical protein